MSDLAIRVENLSKRYTIGRTQKRHDTLRDALSAAFRRNGTSDSAETFWALKDVSFDIKRGEVVGIIGRNGAGKSTLLKILSQITEPTSGRAEIYGRVGSLLEVGTGFHPELTGRENIFLNGAILGMRREEIARQFDEIVAFSEIEKFLDTPVKRYSSGMYVRLAFAVAAHLDPEILLVDEVLAVGDASFQKKALGKMGAVVNEGRTVLFVSHNMAAIRNLTTRSIYIRNGAVAIDDLTGLVVERYLFDSEEPELKKHFALDYYRREGAPDAPIRTNGISIAGQSVDGLVVLPMADELTINIDIQLHVIRPIEGANLTIVLRNSRDERIATIFSWDYDCDISVAPGEHLLTVTIDKISLPPGAYFVDVGINQTTYSKAYDVIARFPLFRISESAEVHHWPERSWGAIYIPNVSWQIEHVNDLQNGSLG